MGPRSHWKEFAPVRQSGDCALPKAPVGRPEAVQSLPEWRDIRSAGHSQEFPWKHKPEARRSTAPTEKAPLPVLSGPEKARYSKRPLAGDNLQNQILLAIE